MTAPINFPTIQAPQLAPPKRSALDGFAEFLVALQGQREERGVRREQLAMQRAKFEADSEIDKLTKTQKLKEIEVADLREQAKEYAAPFVLDLTMRGANANEVTALEIARRMHEQNPNKKLTPYIDEAFAGGMKQNQEGLAALAQRRTAEATATKAGVGARVGVATEDAQVIAGRLQGAITQEQFKALQGNVTLQRLDKTLKQLEIDGFDRGATANAVQAWMASGQPWSTIRKEMKLKFTPGGLSDSDVFAAKDAQDSGTSDVLIANMELANTALNAAKDPGVGKAAWTQLTKNTIWGIPTAILTDPFMDDEQKSLVSAYSAIILPLNKLMSGARASDLDLTTARQTIVIREDDGEQTRAQKIIMREMLPVIFGAQERGDPIAAPMKNVLDAAVAKGVDEKILAPYRKIQLRYELQEGKGKKKDTDEDRLNTRLGGKPPT